MYTTFINISYTDSIRNYYKKAYKDLYDNYNITTINVTVDQEWKTENINRYLTQIYKKKLDDVVDFLQNNTDTNKIYINTFEEWLTSDIHYIKKQVGQEYTPGYELFIDKAIERSIAYQNQKEKIVPAFIDGILETIVWQKSIPFPYIIKPTHWVQSSGVALIGNIDELQSYIDTHKKLENRMQEKWLETDNYIIEEYIDGPMYTMTYFVDTKGNITLYGYDKIQTLHDRGINDFSLFSRSIDPLNPSMNKKIKAIAEITVEMFNIRNTFIYQDLKIDQNWKVKIIEINGRIGWFRLEMYDYAYNINMLRYTIPGYIPVPKYTKNIIAISLRPPKNNVKWLWINQSIRDKILQIPSYKKSTLLKKRIGNVIWFSKYWYTRVWSIILENDNYKQLTSDYEIITKHYKDILFYEQY